MKLLALVLIILFVQIESKYIAFGQQAVNAIFKERKDTFILFTAPSDTESSSQFVASSAIDEDRVYTTVDKQQDKDHFDRFGEYLGISVQNTPILVYLVDTKKKYIGNASDLSAQKLAAFVEKIESGEIKQYLKSAPIPTQQAGATKTIVGTNFADAVLGTQKQVLLKIYAPWCGHCKTIAPHFEAAAEAIKNNPNVILANFDGTLNEFEGLEISGYPTLYWYGKDKTVAPQKYDGGRDKQGILSFIEEHTEYEWLEPQQAEGEEL